MLVLAILALAAMGLCNFLLSRKPLYPPVVFCGIWAVNLLVVWLAGDVFYRVSPVPLLIFVLGPAIFSAGSALVWYFLPAGTQSESASPRLLNLFIVCILCLLPGYILWIKHLAENFDVSNILLGAKLAMGADLDMGSMGPIFNNLIPFSIAVGWIAFLESGRKRAALVIACTLLINLLTGSRSGAIIFLVGLLVIDTIKNHKLRWKSLLVGACSLLICFSLAAYFLQKGFDQEASFTENVESFSSNVATYFTGGAVAFSRSLEQQSTVVHNQHFYQPFIPLLNALGADIPRPIPNIDFNFTDIGPYQSSNVYTIYFFYYDSGIPGTLLLMFLIGAFTTTVFVKASHGSRPAIVLYAFLVSAIILSVFSEYFFVAIGNIVRMYVVAWAVYRLPHFKVRLARSTLTEPYTAS